MKKKLLMYVHYYYPDVASTAQVYTDLCEGLAEQFDITVICTVPSYSGSIAPEYRDKKYYEEEYNGVKIIRVRVCEFSKENKLSRIKNILSYFFRSVYATKLVSRPDVVFTCSQPPILGGLLGVAGKWLTKAKMIYNIQDFNPEQTAAVGYSKNQLILKAAKALDKFSCRQSDLVIIVGRDMQETLVGRFAGKRVPKNTVINNWIDEKEVYPLEKTEPHVQEFRRMYGLEDKFVIMYSGNIGLYYDLENLIRIIEDFKEDDSLRFVFAGGGAVKSKLEEYCTTHQMSNVVFVPYQDKDKLIYSLNAADVHLVTNAKGIKGVSVPSKIYGVMATDIPVFGILEEGSEAWKIVEDSNCGVLAHTGEYTEIEEILQEIVTQKQAFVKEHQTGREFLLSRFTKDRSIEAYGGEIENL